MTEEAIRRLADRAAKAAQGFRPDGWGDALEAGLIAGLCAELLGRREVAARVRSLEYHAKGALGDLLALSDGFLGVNAETGRAEKAANDLRNSLLPKH